MTCGDPQIDRGNEAAFLRGRELRLSATENCPLERLTAHYGVTVTHENLLSGIWRTQDCTTRTIEVCISRLREKFDDGKEPALVIQSHRGRGYCLSLEERTRELD